MDGVGTDKPMEQQAVVGLAGYLLVLAVLTVVFLIALWSAHPQSASGQVPVPACSAGAPVLKNLYPDVVNVGSAGDVLFIGCNFPAASVVKFNGTVHPALFVDASHLRVALAAADVSAAGNIVVTLSNGAADFATSILPVVPAGVYWSFLGGGPWPISQEVQLLLMVILTGAFGSCVYALKSLADYRGDNKLFTSWLTYYLIQPFEGAGIALLLYLVIRGGFLAGTGADIKTVNLFGMCAIAGLAGSFSDIAFLKLREVFQTLFKPQDDRGGKVTPPKITTTALPPGPVGTAYKAALQASGGVAPLKWSVSPNLPKPLVLDESTGAITGTPTASVKASFKFTVTDSGTPPATATANLDLEIKGPATGFRITTDSLLAGAVGKVYGQTLLAAGATGTVTWSVVPDLPKPLTLDRATGAISGTPTTPSQDLYRFTATDSAAPAAPVSADFVLRIDKS